MDLLEKIDKGLSHVLEWFLILAFAIFLVLVCLLVLLRYGLETGITGGNEFVTIAFLYTSAIGGALAISRREHIAITFFIDLLPRPIKKWIYIFGLALIAVLNGFMTYYSISWIEKTGRFPWQPLGWPQGVVQAAVPIGCTLAILYCLIKIILTIGNRENIDVLWMPED